jgi:hypothetical protein
MLEVEHIMRLVSVYLELERFVWCCPAVPNPSGINRQAQIRVI